VTNQQSLSMTPQMTFPGPHSEGPVAARLFNATSKNASLALAVGQFSHGSEEYDDNHSLSSSILLSEDDDDASDSSWLSGSTEADTVNEDDGDSDDSRTDPNCSIFIDPRQLEVLSMTQSSRIPRSKLTPTLSDHGHDEVKDCGNILIRTPVKGFTAMFRWKRKAWKQAFWVQFGDSKLRFFNSRQDFQQWRSNRTQTATTDSNMNNKSKDSLVKLTIDFENDLMPRNVLGYKQTGIYAKRCKESKYDSLYTMKLYLWKTKGTSVATTLNPNLNASIASKDMASIKKLYSIIHQMINASTINFHFSYKYGKVSSSGAENVKNFYKMEYHDEFSDWIVHQKLIYAGFLAVSETSHRQTKTNDRHQLQQQLQNQQ